jgi:hypothetical protein
MRRFPRNTTARTLSALILGIAGACSAPDIAGPREVSQIDGATLNAGVMQRLRAEEIGCSIATPAGRGFKMYGLKPAESPLALRKAEGSAGKKGRGKSIEVSHTIRDLRKTIKINCWVDSSVTAADVAEAASAISPAQWTALYQRVLKAPYYSPQAGRRPLSREAKEFIYERIDPSNRLINRPSTGPGTAGGTIACAMRVMMAGATFDLALSSCTCDLSKNSAGNWKFHCTLYFVDESEEGYDLGDSEGGGGSIESMVADLADCGAVGCGGSGGGGGPGEPSASLSSTGSEAGGTVYFNSSVSNGVPQSYTFSWEPDGIDPFTTTAGSYCAEHDTGSCNMVVYTSGTMYLDVLTDNGYVGAEKHVVVTEFLDPELDGETAETSALPDCDNNLNDFRNQRMRAWCYADQPTSSQRTAINEAIGRIRAKGGVCISVADRATEMMVLGTLRITGLGRGYFGVGSYNTTLGNSWVAIAREVFAYTNTTPGPGGRTLDGEIVHEVDHTLASGLGTSAIDSNGHIVGNPVKTYNWDTCH